VTKICYAVALYNELGGVFGLVTRLWLGRAKNECIIVTGGGDHSLHILIRSYLGLKYPAVKLILVAVSLEESNQLSNYHLHLVLSYI
jgi:hypothetical protein